MRRAGHGRRGARDARGRLPDVDDCIAADATQASIAARCRAARCITAGATVSAHRNCTQNIYSAGNRSSGLKRQRSVTALTAVATVTAGTTLTSVSRISVATLAASTSHQRAVGRYDTQIEKCRRADAARYSQGALRSRPAAPAGPATCSRRILTQTALDRKSVV